MMLASDVIDRAERRVGETLRDKWRLDCVIGVGGMAAVYEATHRNRNRVAIKLLHPTLSLDEEIRRRFLREGYVGNTIDHPGAVKILDDDVTEEGVAFLVMELLQGETLEERLVSRGGVLPPRTVLSLADRLLDVLAAAHAQGVVHRDIKPDNVFLTSDGGLKVLDFGIARLHQGDRGATRHGSFMGTPAFCAPEQARGRWDEVDARTDVFSVGATLFTALTGEHLHQAETPSEQLALAIGTRARSLAEIWPEAPSDVVALVDRALSYDKQHRFQSAEEMQVAVREALSQLPYGEEEGVRASSTATLRRAETVPQTIARLSRKRAPRVGLLLGILFAAALAFALVVVARQQSDSERPRTENAAIRPPSTAASERSSPVRRVLRDAEEHASGRAAEGGVEQEAEEKRSGTSKASNEAKLAPPNDSEPSPRRKETPAASSSLDAAPPSKAFEPTEHEDSKGSSSTSASPSAPRTAPAEEADDMFNKRY